MTRNVTAAVSWLLFAVWFGVLYWLSSRTLEKIPGGEIPFIDKVYHAGYFFLGGILVTVSLAASCHVRKRKLVLFAVGILAAIGALDEWHQTFTPGRSGGDPGDWLADLTGGTVAALIAGYTRHGKLTRLTERPIAG